MKKSPQHKRGIPCSAKGGLEKRGWGNIPQTVVKNSPISNATQRDCLSVVKKISLIISKLAKRLFVRIFFYVFSNWGMFLERNLSMIWITKMVSTRNFFMQTEDPLLVPQNKEGY